MPKNRDKSENASNQGKKGLKEGDSIWNRSNPTRVTVHKHSNNILFSLNTVKHFKKIKYIILNTLVHKFQEFPENEMIKFKITKNNR